VDYRGWRAEQARRRADGTGRPVGIGICTYVERTGVGPEYGAVEVCPDGTLLAVSGCCSTGQGHETSFPQIVASVLDLPPERVRLVQRDTAAVPRGTGTFASRSTQVGGAALHTAATGLVEEARRRAAAVCGVPVAEVTYRAGTLTAGDRTASLAELVAATGPLRVEEVAEPPPAFPFGTHVAVVEVDPELGTPTVLRLVAVDDCGVVVNPLLVAGQGHGSVAQGLGQALYEEVRYDDAGRPVTAGLLDYLLPTAAEMPALTFEETCTPNPNTPLGAKGVGEAGCIGTPPAVLNAIADALDLADPARLPMPATPYACWAAAREEARQPAGSRR
jgi:carbon-monoxide dehydrogenase large subunit